MACGQPDPVVSVLFPTYNTAPEHLREAIESILAQTYADFELVIVDDASPDNCVEPVVRSYTDPRIRFYANDHNLGISGTRNRLLELARGKYLAVMDHDDVSLPRRFEVEVAYLDAHPDVGVVSCHAECIGELHGFMRHPSDDMSIRLALMDRCAVLHPASMLRASVLAEHSLRYEEQFSPAEDYALWCRLMPFTRFHNIPEVLFQYRGHAGNATKAQKSKMVLGDLAVKAMIKTEHPSLHALYLQAATRTDRIKLFGCIPFLKIVSRNERETCTLFGIPLYRRKKSVKLDA